MKDFDSQKTDEPKDTVSPIRKSRKAAEGTRDAGHVVSEIASHSKPDADTLPARELSHPANAAPLADLLGQLQHSHGNVYVQRVVADMNEAKSEVGSQSIDQAQGLEAGTRSEMESAFGENFADVRLHTDADAERLNTELGARAVTQGRDIYFGTGEYNPATRDGKELLAHELAHVVQQRGSATAIQSSATGQSGDEFEREADHAATAAIAGSRAVITARGSVPAQQRQKKDEPPKPESPAVVYHSKEITSTPLNGTIDAAGKFSIAYGYLIAPGAQFVPLTLSLSEGVSVTFVPISSISTQFYRITGSGRVWVLSASYHLVEKPAFQVSFTKGSFTYVVVFRFPSE